MADKIIYWSKTALTGGAANALDSIDGAGLQDGDIAHVFASGVLYVYLLDDDSGAAESSPSVISPDTNAGTKRWINQVAYQADVAVMKALFDANTVLAADSDDTPAAVTIAEQTVLGRLTGGNIKAISQTELTALLNAATDALKGAVELATATEAITGTDTGRAVTPAGSAAALANLKTHDRENIVEDLSYLPPVTATWDPGSLVDGAGETSAAIPYPGVALGLFAVEAIAPYDLQGITCNAYVDAANSVKARLQNETTGTIDLASGTWTFQARRI